MSTHGGAGGPMGPGGTQPIPPQQPQQPVAQPGAVGQQQYGQPQYQQQGGGPGFGERASQAMDTVGRHIKTPETKEFYKTSEFMVWLLTAAAILIASAIIGGDDNAGDAFGASHAWTLIAVVSFAYIISRGISKAGTKRGYGDAPGDRGY